MTEAHFTTHPHAWLLMHPNILHLTHTIYMNQACELACPLAYFLPAGVQEKMRNDLNAGSHTRDGVPYMIDRVVPPRNIGVPPNTLHARHALPAWLTNAKAGNPVPDRRLRFPRTAWRGGRVVWPGSW